MEQDFKNIVGLAEEGKPAIIRFFGPVTDQTTSWFYLDAQDGYKASGTQVLTLLAATGEPEPEPEATTLSVVVQVTSLPVAKTGSPYEIWDSSKVLIATGTTNVAANGQVIIDMTGTGVLLGDWVRLLIDDLNVTNFATVGMAVDWIQVTEV